MINAKMVKVAGTAREVPYVTIKIGGREYLARLDTGADITTVPNNIDLPIAGNPLTIRNTEGTYRRYTKVAKIEVDGITLTIEVLQSTEEGSVVALLGMDIIKRSRLVMERDVFTLEILEEENAC